MAPLVVPVVLAATLALATVDPAHTHTRSTRSTRSTPGVAAPAACLEGKKDSKGYSSVDSGEIAWEDETKYDDAMKSAHKVWVADGLDRVKFPQDDATRIADLEWSDVNTTKDDWQNVNGAWTPLPGTDLIRLNDAYLGRGKRHAATAHRRMIAAHELGHALGFCHKSPDWYVSLMAPHFQDLPANGRPTGRDRTNYHKLWG